MNKISEIWERTIGIEGVDTGYPKFEKELLQLHKKIYNRGYGDALKKANELVEEHICSHFNPKGDIE